MFRLLFLAFLSAAQLIYSTEAQLENQDALDRFHICTVATHHRPTLDKLIHSCQTHHIDLEIIGMGKPYYGWGTKFIYLMEYLERLDDQDIVMFVDAFDVLILKDKEEILSRFLKMKAPLVVSGERGCWPCPELADRYPPSPSSQKYINSGSYIGYVKNLKQFFSSQTITYEDDDQLLFTKYFLNAPLNKKPLKIDYQCNLFLTLWLIEEHEVVISREKHSVLFLPTDSEPCVVHANGHTFSIWDKIYAQLFQDQTRRKVKNRRRGR